MTIKKREVTLRCAKINTNSVTVIFDKDIYKRLREQAVLTCDSIASVVETMVIYSFKGMDILKLVEKESAKNG